MTTLGITYLVLAAISLVAAVANAAQAVLVRTDPVPLTVAMSCLGFFLYCLGFAVTHGSPGLGDPWWGLLGFGFGFALIAAFVPMTGWTLLELPLTSRRLAFVLVLVVIALARAVDVLIHRSVEPDRTWLAVPGGLAALAISGLWTFESVRCIPTRTPYARAMALFGAIGFASTLAGMVVVARLVQGPDLFGFAAAPFTAFVNTLLTLRYVHVLKNPNQPAGDMSRYQVLERLGSGGMGDVYLARRRGPAGFVRDVVLKTLREASDDPSAHQRFLSEARLAAQLRHPNIVDVYDLGEQPGGFFIVMERIDGPTLGQVLETSNALGRRIAPTVVAELGVQLCRALGFAHAAGVVHRDLKPQNVMLSNAGVAKLIDFGIAQGSAAPAAVAGPAGSDAGSGPLTEDRGVVGTRGYISPERLFGGPAGPASDLFALGVVLFQALTHEYPFAERSAVDFIAAVRSGVRGRLLELRPDCPRELAEAIEQCLHDDPALRPSSAAGLEALLERSLRGERVDLAGFVAGLFPSGVLPAVSQAPTTPVRDATTATVSARPR